MISTCKRASPGRKRLCILQITEGWTPQHELKSGAKSWWGTLVEMGKNGPKYQQTLGEALVTRYIIRYV